MTRLLFVLLCLCHFTQGTGTGNTTSATCPELPEGLYRSTWSILGSCALTLVICLWHTVHLNVPCPEEKEKAEMLQAQRVFFGFFIPEWLVAVATQNWMAARESIIHFRAKNYEWSMTHSHFAISGGFAFCDKERNIEIITPEQFLERCEAGKIMNPFVTEDEIKEKGKSDAMSKAIFTIQLLWFMIQVAVRYARALTVTLVELDTLCMAVLALCYLFLWWKKPLNVRSPHIFYESQEKMVFSQEELSRAWRPKPSFVCRILHLKKAQMTNDVEDSSKAIEVCCLRCKSITALDKMIQSKKSDMPIWEVYVACVTWFVLGAVHLAAWNYEFPTIKEMWIWRTVALTLMGTPLVGLPISMIAMKFLARAYGSGIWKADRVRLLLAFYILPGACRLMLAVLMFLSLRTLPCSAHQIVPWTQYIPHL